MNKKEKVDDDVVISNKIEENMMSQIDLFYRTYYSNINSLLSLNTNEIYKNKDFHFYNFFNNKLLLESLKKENEKFQDNQKDYMHIKKLCFIYLTIKKYKK